MILVGEISLPRVEGKSGETSSSLVASKFLKFTLRNKAPAPTNNPEETSMVDEGPEKCCTLDKYKLILLN